MSYTRFKEFCTLWSYSFCYPSVNNNSIFWRVWGLVDIFNKYHMKIILGVEKTSDEPMKNIWIQNTPKDEATHYYFIFSNTDPLWTELSNYEWYTLGTILYLDTKKVKEVKKTIDFQKEFGGKEDRTKIIMKAKKVVDNFHQLKPSLLVSALVDLRQWRKTIKRE